jgi:hypothetical protein
MSSQRCVPSRATSRQLAIMNLVSTQVLIKLVLAVEVAFAAEIPHNGELPSPTREYHPPRTNAGCR